MHLTPTVELGKMIMESLCYSGRIISTMAHEQLPVHPFWTSSLTVAMLISSGHRRFLSEHYNQPDINFRRSCQIIYLKSSLDKP